MWTWTRLRQSDRALVTLGVLGGSFLGAIEATMVATAMPTVVDHLGGLAHYSWVFAAYLLTSTVTTPVWGRLSDIYGRRRFYLAAIGVLVVGSVLSGTASGESPRFSDRWLARSSPSGGRGAGSFSSTFPSA